MDFIHEKDKNASEMETDDYEPNEEFGEYEKESLFHVPDIENCLPISDFLDSTESETESTSEESYETKRMKAMKLKWLTVPGRKPLNLPLAMIYQGDKNVKMNGEVITRFGERRPMSIDEKRKENWLKMKMSNRMSQSYTNLGRVLMEIRLMEHFWGNRCLRFSPNGDTMAISFGDGVVQIRNLESGEVNISLQTIDSLYKLAIPALRYHPRIVNRLYVGGGAGDIQLFDTKNPKYIASVGEKNNEICNLDINSDGSVLVSVGKDGNVYIYDAMSLRLKSVQQKPLINENTTSEHEVSYHYMRIFGLKFHPSDPDIFVTGGWDNTVKVWDTRVNGAVRSISGPRICGDSIDVRNNEILTGSWTALNGLKLWDLSSGRMLRNINIRNRSSPLEGDFIYVAKFFTGLKNVDAIVIGGNGTDEVEVVDIGNQMAIASFPALKAVTALDCNRELIAYGGMESVLRIGDLKNQERHRTK